MPDLRRAAVLGSPIEHSLSPALHTAAYAALGLADWTYTAIECDEAGLPALVAARSRVNSYPRSAVNDSSARVSFGKHDPPQPSPGRR